MARHSRKSSRSSGGKKDPLTGLKTGFGAYGVLQADKVYGQEIFDKAAQATGQDSGNTGESQLEIELSPSQIVVTSTFKGNENSYSGNLYQRALFTGIFTYKRGAITSAVIKGIAGLNYVFDKSGDISLETAYIEDFKTPKTISNPNSTEQWNAVLAESGSTSVVYAQRSYPGNPADSGRIEDVYGYGGGRIFEANWWQDPFAPNLI
jgi:hypothetical protein